MNRTMTTVLAEELFNLTRAERNLVVRLADSPGHSPLLARLLRGLKAQVLIDACREDDVLRAHEADHRAHVEAVDRRLHGDPPPVVGKVGTHDPDTGEWTFE